MGRWITAVVVIAAACSTSPGGTPADAAGAIEDMREQIHAATGHDPEACTSMMGEKASIRIGDEGSAIPGCIILQEHAELVVSNESSVDQRFAVSDPPNQNVRHDIYVLEIPPGAMG